MTTTPAHPREERAAGRRGEDRGRTAWRAFYRTTPDGRAVTFTQMPDANDVMCHVRQVPDVRATGDATPLLVLTSASGDNEEGHLSTVVVAADDHALEVVERSIRALQSVRDGLLDAGHIDY